MDTRVTIDRAGRVVVPKAVRDELRLQPGDELELRSGPDSITLAPVHNSTTLVKEQGVWVYRSGVPSSQSLPTIIDEDRQNRRRDVTK